MKHKPTDEQAHIVDLYKSTNDNIMINSLAGTGKTTMLELLEPVTKKKPILYLCFNRRNADEAKDKFPETTSVRTINGCGYRVWVPAIGKDYNSMNVDGKKSQGILRQIIDSAPKSAQPVLWDVFWDVVSAVGMAKSVGYVPEGKFPAAHHLATKEEFYARLDEEPDELVAELIDEVLFHSIKASYNGHIDFDDQVYMPALFGGSFPRFPNVWTDETQDLNPVNHRLIHHLVKGRYTAVGDPWQSIYGFRGAVQDGMGLLKQKYKMTECSITTSFRCPQAVVEASRWRVPHFKWIKPGGSVDVLTKLIHTDIADDAAIICRNNAPLFSMALHLLMHRRSVSVAGSDVGPRIIGIMKKLGDDDMSRSSLLSRIEDWRAEKLVKQSANANDIADCMKVFATFGDTLGQAIGYAEHMFEQRGKIRLLTGHKAKGLEWDTVYHLDPWLIGDAEQELNLRYVITTRAKQQLFEVNSKDIQW